MDDLLYCLHNPRLILDAMTLAYDKKNLSVGPNKIYLGAKTNKYQDSSGKSQWSMSSTNYTKN